MCIAIFKPKEHTLTRDTLKICFEGNSHGAGFAYPDGGKMVVDKGYFKFKEFWEAYSEVQKKALPMLIHFRYRTHGLQNAENCHPWQIDAEHAMIHNGVIKQFSGGNKKGKLSDTGKFNEHVLKPMFLANSRQWLENWSKCLIEDFIGTGNKVVILSANGDYQIYREEFGTWSGGCWFSNDGFKPKKEFWLGRGHDSHKPSKPLVHNVNPTLDMTKLDAVLERLETERKSGKKKDKKDASEVSAEDRAHDSKVAAEVTATLTAQGRTHELEHANHGSE